MGMKLINSIGALRLINKMLLNLHADIARQKLFLK